MGGKKESAKSTSALEIKVMMIGGRRCGKTSVLAAMQSCFKDVLRGTPFGMNTLNDPTNASRDPMDELEAKRNEVTKYFLDKTIHRTFVPDDNPTFDEKHYTFRISLKGSSDIIKIEFVDIPGEWLADGVHREDIEKLMAESRILLVAIDTPHLMEAEGRYNDQRNRCYRICEMIESVGFADAAKGAGLILLIPLKCERYRNDGRMEEVAARTSEAYQELSNYIMQPGKDGEKSLCQVAVTPIFTMGGAAFDRFKRDDNGEIIINGRYDTPQCALYYFPDMTKKAPEPLYCEQPLLYVLEFTLNAMQAVIKKKNLWGILTAKLAQILKNTPVNPLYAIIADFLAEGIGQWHGAEDYLECAEDIRKRLKRSGDGYRILIGAAPGGKH